MRTLFLLSLTSALLLSGCGEHIPEVPDPDHIVVDGKPMTPKAFLERYCHGQELYPSCVAVRRKYIADAAHGGLPSGW